MDSSNLMESTSTQNGINQADVKVFEGGLQIYVGLIDFG
jgi:hypothetical protein